MNFITLLLLIFVCSCQSYKRAPNTLTNKESTLEDTLKFTPYCENMIKDSEIDKINFRYFDGQNALFNMRIQQNLLEPNIEDYQFVSTCPELETLHGNIEELLKEKFKMTNYEVKLIERQSELFLEFNIVLERVVKEGVTEMRKFSSGAVNCALPSGSQKVIQSTGIKLCNKQ